MDTYARVTRNTVEVVTDEELRSLLDRPVRKVTQDMNQVERSILGTLSLLIN